VVILKHLAGGSDRGFTLVELIVSVAIVGILATVVVLKISGPAEANSPNDSSASAEASADVRDIVSPSIPEGLQPEAEALANRLEYRIIQTALDTLIIREGLTSVDETASTGDMSAFPAGHPLYPRYLREPNTKCLYSCDSTGQVKQSPR
jgi:prepilin-type N-terminal cleavage/methylation domain-containing protein